MTVQQTGDAVALDGVCSVEDAEMLLQALQTGARAVQWGDCVHLHTACLQVLLAAGLPMLGCPNNAVVGLQSDVTTLAKREEAEDQRQKMESLGRMVGGVAHEINNMLQPVIMLGQDLLDQAHVAPAGRPHLDVVLECSRRARDIIGDLLAFSRPTARAMEDHELLPLLDEGLRIARQAVPPGVKYTVQICGKVPRYVVADRTMFVQIVLNLVSNAVAAIDGAGTLAITLDEDDAERVVAPDGSLTRFARLRVIDSGCGMDRATLDRAFEPFFTTKPIGQGTGLGLPIVYGRHRQRRSRPAGRLHLRQGDGHGPAGRQAAGA